VPVSEDTLLALLAGADPAIATKPEGPALAAAAMTGACQWAGKGA
jgi:hypothetical protein